MDGKISELAKQLLNLGYHQSQIDNIFRDAVGTTDVKSLTKKEEAQVTEDLLEYITFATKCHKKRR